MCSHKIGVIANLQADYLMRHGVSGGDIGMCGQTDVSFLGLLILSPPFNALSAGKRSERRDRFPISFNWRLCRYRQFQSPVLCSFDLPTQFVIGPVLNWSSQHKGKSSSWNHKKVHHKTIFPGFKYCIDRKTESKQHFTRKKKDFSTIGKTEILDLEMEKLTKHIDVRISMSRTYSWSVNYDGCGANILASWMNSDFRIPEDRRL